MRFAPYMDAEYFRRGMAYRVFAAAAEVSFDGEPMRKVAPYTDDFEDARSVVAQRKNER